MAFARLPCDYRAYEHARAQAQETDMPSNDDQEPAPARSAGSLEGLRRKGLYLRSQGMHEGAAEAFAELLSQHPHDARGHVDLAISLRAMGQPGEAIKILGGALDNACSVSFRRPCILQIARCHRALGNLDSARSYLEEALRLSADDIPVLLELAAICTQSLAVEEAQDLLSKAGALIAMDADGVHKNSYTIQQADFDWLHGDPDRAIQALYAHTRANHGFTLMRRLVTYLARRGRPREAMAELQLCYAAGVFSPMDERCLEAHIETLRRCGDIATATLLAEQSLSKFPHNEILRVSLSELYTAQLSIQAAHDVLLPQAGNAMSLTKAQLLNMQGEKDSARILLHDCVSNGKLTRAQKCKALQTLFHLELFLLNFDASRAALRSLIETSTEQHLNLILQDQQDIFERNAHDLRSYQGVRDIETLCRLHLDKTNLGFGTGICSASWMFMNTIGQMRSWWSLSFKAVLEHMSATPKIPRIIVQYWDQDNVPTDVAMAMKSWKENYPEFNHVLHNKCSAELFLAKHFPAGLLARFNASPHPAMRSDIFRMAWLFVHGGFYIDADELSLCRSPAFFLNSDYVSPIVFSSAYETQNGFIGAIPANPMIARFLENIMSVSEDDFRSGLIWWLTGPGHMSQILSVHVARRLLDANQETNELDDILSAQATLLPKAVLEMAMVTPRLKYKQTELSWQRARSKNEA